MGFNLAAVSPRVKPAGSSGVHIGVSDRPAQGQSHWRFDAIPQEILDDVRRGRLSRIDPDVLGIILRYRRPRLDSAWVTKKKIAEVLNVSARTVQASIKRLVQFRWLDHRQVGRVDPVDPRNRTGWRFFFLWVSQGLGSLEDTSPDRLPAWAKTRPELAAKEFVNSVAAKTFESGVGDEGDKNFSPLQRDPEEKKLASPEEAPGELPPVQHVQDLLHRGSESLLPSKEEQKESNKETFNVPKLAKPPEAPGDPKPLEQDTNANVNARPSLSLPASENSKIFSPPLPESNSDAVDCEEYDRATRVIQEMLQLGLPLNLIETPDGPQVRYSRSPSSSVKVDEYVQDLVCSNKRGVIHVLRNRPRPLDAVQQAAHDKFAAEMEKSRKQQEAMLRGKAELLAAVDALATGPEAACDRLAEAMVKLFRESDPEQSRRTFFGMARDVRAGRLPASILSHAIVAACEFPGERPGRVVVRRVSDALKTQWKARQFNKTTGFSATW